MNVLDGPGFQYHYDLDDLMFRLAIDVVCPPCYRDHRHVHQFLLVRVCGSHCHSNPEQSCMRLPLLHRQGLDVTLRYTRYADRHGTVYE